MRCPKCQYLGFDGQDRCRNCGYDFSLSQTLTPEETAAAPDPVIGGDSTPADADLLLRPEPTARERARAAIQKRQARQAGGDAFDLPLFAGSGESAPPEPARPEPRAPMPRSGEGRPFVSSSPTPRPPLSVRRAASEPARARGGAAIAPTPAEPPAMTLDAPLATPSTPDAFDVDDLPMSLAEPEPASIEPEIVAPRAEAPIVAPRSEPVSTDAAVAVEPDADNSNAAPIQSRVIAGLIDAGILGVIDLVVIAFTLRLTALGWNEVWRLPVAPLAAFLALLATGYLAMFTVLAGQTAGKMAMNIRVVETRGGPVRFGHAVLRAAVQVLTVPLLGLGFLPALLGSDRRALYDRLSETEVVRGDPH